MSAAEFFSGKTATPKYISLENGAQADGPSPPSYTPTSATRSQSAPSPSSAPSSSTPTESPSILSKLKSVVSPYTEPEVLEPPSPAQKTCPEPARSVEKLPSPSEPSPPSGQPTADQAALHDEIAKLKEELSERDLIIRNLEVKVERLQVAHKKAQALYAEI